MIIAIVFAALGVWPLVWFNLVSVPVWALASWLLWLERPEIALLIGELEVLAHNCFATWILGWDVGFHAYILMITAFSANRIPRWRTAAYVGVWLALYAVLGHATPVHPLSPVAHEVMVIGLQATAWATVGLYVLSLTRAAVTAQAQLAIEHARSENLLANILPATVARRLKDGEGIIADGVADASVLFADIVGFTALSATLAPADLVVMLNEVFSRIDVLVERHGLEKIKTIGDAYMVAAGLPVRRADHTAALAAFALEMIEAIDTFDAGNGARLQIRVGIHLGPVVAGVIGKKKFAYDLWGDTVNTAARMESHGMPGRIHVSAAVYDKLRDAFVFEPRGSVEIKGKGAMATWFLLGPAPRRA